MDILILSPLYNLPYFKETDPAVVHDFIKSNPFALLTGATPAGSPVATQLPMFLEDEDSRQFLRGHMMRNTDHHKVMAVNDQVLVVFTGPHCYVSATWYSDPHQASTWNYMSVHVKGRIRFTSPQSLLKILEKTTMYFENMNSESSTVLHNLTEEYVNRLLPAIVPFEIEIDSIENVFKLSQNRDRESYLNIIAQLEKGDHNQNEIAKAMAERFEDLYREV